MEDSPKDGDPNINPELTEKNFIKSEYIFHLDNTNKKFDHIIDHAVKNTKAYKPFFHKFNHFALTFNFLTRKERYLPFIYCSHEVMLRTKLTHTYRFYKFLQRHYIHSSTSRNPNHRFIFINSNKTDKKK